MNGNDSKKCEEFCGNCDDGRYIGKNFSAEDYNEYLQIPENIQKEIADNLFVQLKIESHKGTEIKIFTAGVGPGRIEIPFLNKCLKDGNGISLKLTAVDLDARMLREFYDNIYKYEEFESYNIKDNKLEYANGTSKDDGINYFSLNIKNSSKKNNIEIVAFCGNLENLNKKLYYIHNHYDYVFSIFVLHAITNWEEPLYHLLGMLKPEGKIVFAEEIGDVNWLDNHFDDIEKHSDTSDSKKNTESNNKRLPFDNDILSHRKFWKEYHRARKDLLGKEWAKDTKASDLGVIDTCLRKMEDFGLVKDCSTDKNVYRWKAEHLFTFKKLLEWIKGVKPLYTPLSYGLGNPGNNSEDTVKELKTEIVESKWDVLKNRQLCDFHEILSKYKDKDKDIGDQDVLAIYMELWLKKNTDILLDKKIPRNEGHKFHIYSKKFEADKEGIVHNILYGNTVCLYRLRERIAYEIHRIPGHHKGEVPPNEMIYRLFSLRDMYFRLFPFTHTIYVKWKLDDPTALSKGHLDEKNMPVLLTFPEWHKQCNNEKLLIHLKKYLATYVIYTWVTFNKKETTGGFSFIEFVFRDMPEKFPIIIRRNPKITEVSINFLQVSSGKVKLLEVCIPERLIRKFVDGLRFKTNNGREDINFAETIDKIMDTKVTQTLLNSFIDKVNSHTFYNQENSFEYQNSILFRAKAFFGLKDEIQRCLNIKEVDIVCLEKEFQEAFKNEIESVSEDFKNIRTYNDWPEDIPVKQFLFSAVRAAVIGYNTKGGEWDLFSKYPGKCFDHEVIDEQGKVREEGIGGLIVMRKKLEDKLEMLFERNHEEILPIITGLWGRNDSILELNRLTKKTMIKHGTKAAVAAIMARNMSHLLGSHIEPGIVNDKEDFKKAVKGTKNKIKCTNKKPISLVWEKSIERYSTYRQRRMDFIARVSTQWPSWGAGYEFYKQFVFPFMSNSILLHFVGYSDGFSINSMRFVINIDSYNTKEIINEDDYGLTPRDIAVALVLLKDNLESPLYEIKTKQYYPIVLWSRGGDMGIAAFYIILENVIRNSIKHSKITKKKIELDICLFSGIEDMSKKVQFSPECRLLSNNRGFSYIVVSSKADNDIVANNIIDGLVMRSVINESGGIDPEAWGIKEIKICAAFLANKPDSSVNDTIPDFIQAGTLNGNLAYCFLIPKLYYIGELVKDEKGDAVK